MQLDPNPFFRKPITPWYDSNFSCWVLIGFMILVLAFALSGIFVGFTRPEFLKHIWFPSFLGCLSLFLVIKIFLRLRKRSKND